MTTATLLSDKETDDNFRYVTIRFNDRWRLIVGTVVGTAHGTQWVLQQRRGKQWHGRKYFARAAHIPTPVRQLVGEDAYRRTAAWAAKPALKHT